MLADLDCVERQQSREMRIHVVDVGALRYAAPDIRLVGDDNQRKAFTLQLLECSARAERDNELSKITRRTRFAVMNNRFIQYTIAIEKDGWLTGPNCQLVPSHLVCPILRSGWVTRRCHITP